MTEDKDVALFRAIIAAMSIEQRLDRIAETLNACYVAPSTKRRPRP